MSDSFHPDRLEKLAELRALGVDPYPARSPQGREATAALVAAVDQRLGEAVTIHGRVLGRRGYGKLAFLDVGDQSGKLQACLQKDRLPAGDFALLKALNLGDIVSVSGELGKTKTGEPTVFGASFQILTKSLAQPPEKWHGLSDVELRARQRYVDLFSNQEVRDRFLRRSRIIAAMRQVFLGRDYTEVETPVLHPIYGGANARPFLTHHNALDMRLYLRIAPELYLKRLLVGNIERVFEFARVFRNEGLSPRHNPEFTMLEFYEAYSDYHGMMEMTERLVVEGARAAGLEQPDGALAASFREERFDLSPPFERVRYAEAFERYVGCDPLDRDAVLGKMREHQVVVEGDGDYAWWKAVNDLFEELVEPELRGPVFVYDYPAAICPLTKPSAEDPVWAERFEFFLGGMELANAFSELNDPQLQLAKFEEQVADKDPEAPNVVDYDYVRALAYGLPPAGGCGIGVDRLVMVLLGCDSIREVLLFPHLRPEAVAAAEAAGTEA
ncbi:MAG: lysine--tRNA ligase [Planctomycetes bacterium]|nr:lysine--tRNA ligase [Planctomycetota bacterium]